MLVGFVQRNEAATGRGLRNALALLDQGTLAADFHKSLLPTYDVFDEHRYFEPGERARTFELVRPGRSIRLGVTICEDLWNEPQLFRRALYHRHPLDELVQDGAELIIPGCTIIGTLCTKLFMQDSVKALGVPVIDPQIVAFKQAEMMVDLCKLAGYPAVSRYGLWRKQPQEEFDSFRKWMKEHESPEQYYQK